MQHYFSECPDCGEYYSKVGNVPELDRNTKIYSSDSVVKSRVKAICNRCGWETKSHDNVGECAKEWNNTVIDTGDSANNLDYWKEASSLASKVMNKIYQLDKTGELLYAFMRNLKKESMMFQYRRSFKNEYDFVIVQADEYKKLKEKQ